MAFDPQPSLHGTPESRRARHDLIRQEFNDAQSDGNLLFEAVLIVLWPVRLPWRLLRAARSGLARLR